MEANAAGGVADASTDFEELGAQSFDLRDQCGCQPRCIRAMLTRERRAISDDEAAKRMQKKR
jgi:hypothetical protein